MLIGFLASAIAGLATLIGALPILLTKQPSPRIIAIMLGFGGGVMLAASAFSLIIPGTDAAIELGYSKPVAALIMVIGLILGGWFLEIAHNLLPHSHFVKGFEGNNTLHLAKVWLFIIAITLHNFPEGLAVGVSFGGNNLTDGLTTALGIGLQNMPEGLVVALSLVAEGYSKPYALGISLLTGLVEPIGGAIGVSIVSLSQEILPWAMGFAAGAMLFVICDEIIPEASNKGHEREGTIGIMAGFMIMMYLDIALG